MIKVNSRVKIDQIAIKKLTKAATTALEQTAGVLHTEIGQSQVIPMDKGTLSGEGFAIDCSESSQGKVSLIHNTPYARRLYFHPEYDFNDEFHANAQGEWFKDWMLGGEKEDFTGKAFAQIYKRESGV